MYQENIKFVFRLVESVSQYTLEEESMPNILSNIKGLKNLLKFTKINNNHFNIFRDDGTMEVLHDIKYLY